MDGSPTPEDFLVALRHWIAVQKGLAAHLTICAVMIACAVHFVVPGSAILAVTGAMLIAVTTGLRNSMQHAWAYTAFCLWRDPPSKPVVNAAFRLVAWSVATDVGPLVVMLLTLRQVGLAPDPFR